ncbi:MAG TPA: site-2 protease family protein [Solirubrobacteraceae bacterium]|nr:site-2 protease family protein [Solirubrobacteraceae bacterium]
MTGRSFRIARIAGIPIGVSPWWLVIVALITWSLGDVYFPEVVANIAPATAYALGLASALLLFASILLHELGHAIVARRHGIEIEEIDLWLLGGVSKMRGEAHNPDDELRYALAGPAVTAVIAALFGAIALLLPSSTPAILRALIDYQALVNCLILVFNLLPAFPLDGGRVLRSLMWRRSGDMRKATDTAASVGRVFGYLLVGLGALELVSGVPQGLWLAVIGFFIIMAASAQAVGAEVQAVFSGVPARRLMSTPVVSIPAGLSIERAASEYFLPYRYTAFPAIDSGGRLAGLVEVRRVEAVPPPQRALRTVADIADPDPQLTIGEDEDVATLLERPAFARVGRAVVVSPLGVPVGLLSITDVQRTLRASRIAGVQPEDRPTAAVR